MVAYATCHTSVYAQVVTKLRIPEKTVNIPVQGVEQVKFEEEAQEQPRVKIVTWVLPPRMISTGGCHFFPIPRSSDIHPSRDMEHTYLNSGFGVVENPQGGGFHVRGSRNEPLVFVDGVKIRGRAYVPYHAIQTCQLIMAGLPSDIGDTDSGAILIHTFTP